MPERHPSALSGTLRKPFAEQLAFFRRKLGNLVPTARWDDLTRAEHDRGFMVAGAMKADLLTDLAAAVDRTMAEGKSLEAFRKDFRAIVARRGWHGWTGEDSKTGRAWRTRTIYRTNAWTSYSAGRHAQLVAGNFAFWVYLHGGAQHPRPIHLNVFNGLVLPFDHPFWRIFYPPSDWGCHCYVVGARSERGAIRLGGDPAKKLPDGWDKRDPRTGTPKGAGRNWDYAPGESVSPLVRAIAEKITSWDYRIAKAFMEEVPEAQRDALAQAYRSLPSVADDLHRYAKRTWEGRPQGDPGRTLGLLTRDQAAAIAAQGPKGAAGFDFSLSPSEVAHIRASHGNDAVERKLGQRAVVPDDFGLLPRVLAGAEPRYVGVSDRHKVPVFEVRATIDGEEFVTRWEYWRRRRTLTLLNLMIRTGKRS